MDKKMIRNTVLHKLKQLTENERIKQEEKIYEMLFASKQWEEAKTVFLYKNFRHEISTLQIFAVAKEQNKTIAVPHIVEKNHMIFLKVDDQTEWKQNKWGIDEVANVCEGNELVPKPLDLMIVPGVVFTAGGHRLGWGGGYYDRYLEHIECKTISLAYNEQIIRNLPVEKHDVTIQRVISAEMIFD